MPSSDPSAGGLRGVTIVLPTSGRRSLGRVLEALPAGALVPDEVIVVDDRPTARHGELALPTLPAPLAGRVRVVRGPGRGPAAARNVGWRSATSARWVAFLDDDVVPEPDWLRRLADDLAGLPEDVAGSQGVIRVPLPSDRRATDWERTTQGLERARWATADMAYRRRALEAVGGFDERFTRAYREDADLGLRVTAGGGRIVRGARRVEHPVRPAGPLVSLRQQAGNADDPLMRVLHGPGWRERAAAPPGRRRRHLAITAAGLGALALHGVRRPRAARVAALAWAGGTLELAAARIVPGPRTGREVATMAATSAVMPALATVHWLRGVVRARRTVRAE